MGDADTLHHLLKHADRFVNPTWRDAGLPRRYLVTVRVAGTEADPANPRPPKNLAVRA